MGHPFDDTLDLRAIEIADGGDLVRERDLRREEEIRSSLARIASIAEHEDRRLDLGVELAQAGDAVSVGIGRDPDDDPIRRKEVLDGGPFLGELRVEHHRDRATTRGDTERVDLCGDGGDERRRAGGADDDHPSIADVRDHLRQARGHRPCLPLAFVIHRADGDERDVRRRDGIDGAGGEPQATICQVLGDHLAETWLMERHFAGEQHVAPHGRLLDSDDVVAPLSSACCGDQPDVALAYDGNFQCKPPPIPSLVSDRSLGQRLVRPGGVRAPL